MKNFLPLLLMTFVSLSSVERAVAQPANNLCVTAEPIFCGSTVSGTTVGASADGSLPFCGTTLNSALGVWYTFIGDGFDATASTCNQAAYDTRIGVFSGTCGALVCVGGNDDALGCGGFTSEITFATVCGETYYIYVTGFNAGSFGTFNLTLSCVGGVTFPIAAQDITVQLDGTGNYVFDTPVTPQTNINQPITGGSSANTQHWQSFTPTVSGVLHSLGVTFAAAHTLTLPMQVDIVSGEGTGGLLLHQVILLPPTSFSAGVSSEIVLDGTIDLVAGNLYSFVITSSAGPFSLQRNDLDPYAGGRNGISATSDYVFSIDILQRPEIDNGSTATDGIQSFGLSQTSFSCADVGVNPVTLTVTDNLGATSSCVVTVTVEDDEDPVALCIPFTPASQVVNNYSLFPGSPIDPPVNFNSVITVPDTYNMADVDVNLTIDHTWVGDLIITLEHNGTTVLLLDQIGAPALGSDGCDEADIDVTLDDAGGLALEDACGGGGPIVGTFTAIDLLSAFNGDDVSGDWTLNVIDAFGGADDGILQSWSLDITENIPAVYTQFSLDAIGNYTLDPNSIDNVSSDNCGVVLTVSPSFFTCVDAGVQSVTLTATDPSGNTATCTTDIEIVDDITPTAICQNITVQLDGAGATSIVPAQIDNGSTDNCNISMSLSKLDFNCADLGVNTVTLTVEDPSGNTATCTATVTVEDIETPTINCVTDIEICADNASGATVTYPAITGLDNCIFTITQTDVTGLTSGNVFPLGVTMQEWTIEDVAGNTATCSFTITVFATPNVDYEYSPACQGEAITFTDLSTIHLSTTIVGWSWDMDDGSALIGLVDPIHNFAALGDYNVALSVISAQGCINTTVQTVSVTPVPAANFTFVEECQDDAVTFTNTSTIAAGVMNYQWDFGDGTPLDNTESPNHTYTNFGTYTVTLTVTSDGGCQDVTTASVNVFALPTALFTATTECNGFATEFTNLTTGSGVLAYQWDFDDATPVSTDFEPVHPYTNFGDYNVVLTVTDDNMCTNAATGIVTVLELPTTDFNFTDACEGTDVPFQNTSDLGSYVWDFDDATPTTGVENPVHVFEDFGMFEVTLTVTDGNFCINSSTQTVEIFDLPDFTLNPTDVACYGEATGSIAVIDAGLPAIPWSLTLNSGTPQLNNLNFLGLEAGNYEVVVVDANSCEFSVTTTVGQPDDTLGIQLNNIDDILCNGTFTGEISIEGLGGTAPYMYQVNAGGLSPIGVFVSLEAGDHAVQVVDANSCVFDTIITLTEPDTLILTLVDSMNLLCNGDNSGWLTVLGTGGVMPYEYNLDGGVYVSDQTFSGLAADTYSVVVRDANGCTDTLSVTLTEPGILQLSIINSDSTLCYSAANGSIEVAASSGTPLYQYSSDGINFQGSGLFEGLFAGTHTITVMDANGCLDQVTQEIFEPTELTIETSSVPVACFGNLSGSMQINATGGLPSYGYSIDGGATFVANGGTFANLASNNYLIVVQDINGCSISEGVVISQPSSAFSLSGVVTDVGCLNDATGSVLLIGAGGTPTYMYADDNATFVIPNAYGNLPAGAVTFYGMDLNGCSDSVEVVIGQPATAVDISGTIESNPACPNESTGSITVLAANGTPGYTYSSDGGNTFQSNSILTGLGNGNHLVLVMDANGCIDTDTVELIAPTIFALSLDSIVGVDCEKDTDGEIHVTVSGGTPSYNYQIDGGNFQSNGNFFNLTFGTYTVNITDVNGCSFWQDVQLPTVNMEAIPAFSFLVSGEAVLFTNQSQFEDTYLWDFGDGNTSTDESPTHVYTEPGNYTVTLTVTNDCGATTTTVNVSTINTSIGENEKTVFGLYPNPANNELFLQATRTIEKNMTIDVISMTGQLMLSLRNAPLDVDGRLRIDLNQLSNGMYFLRVLSEKEQSVLRFDIIK